MSAIAPFREPVHVGRPNIGDRARLHQRLDEALERRWLSNHGPLVAQFEEQVARLSGTRHAVATCNATSGLQIAARAAGVRPGDEVIVPAFTWVATPHALEWIGVVPVFCDVHEETGCIDVEHAAELIGPRTRAILGVHVFGHPCDVAPLAELARSRGLALLFDAAHAFGATWQGRPIGGFGDAEVFSFHATKYVNTFEGGAVVTDDDELAETARAMRNDGLDAQREVVGPGTVARMSEVSAAMGLTSLESMEEFIAVNARNYQCYVEQLAGIAGVRVRNNAAGERANYQYVVIEVDQAVTGVHRDRVHEALGEHNVLSRRYFHPSCHELEPYRRDPARHAPLPLPRTMALTQRVLSLPTGTAVGPEQIGVICDIIRETLQGGAHPQP